MKKKLVLTVSILAVIAIVFAVIIGYRSSLTELQKIVLSNKDYTDLVNTLKSNASIVVTENNSIYEKQNVIVEFINSITNNEDAVLNVVDVWYHKKDDTTYGGYTKVKEIDEYIKDAMRRSPDNYLQELSSSSIGLVIATGFDKNTHTEIYIERACRLEYTDGKLYIHTYIEDNKACKKSITFTSKIVNAIDSSPEDNLVYRIFSYTTDDKGLIEDIIFRVSLQYEVEI